MSSIRLIELVVKPVSDLTIKLARIVEVEASKGEAVIEQYPAVRDVGTGNGGRERLAKALSNGKIDLIMSGKVLVRVVRVGGWSTWVVATIGKTRAVIHVRRGIGMKRQRRVEAHVERVALVVVNGRVSEACVAGRVASRDAD